MNIYRHGDLSFHPLKGKPENLKEEKFAGEYILALGEHTNHAHRLTATKEAVRVFRDADGGIVLEILGKAILTHEEHKPIEFKLGWYRLQNEREYDYFSNSTAMVQD